MAKPTFSTLVLFPVIISLSLLRTTFAIEVTPNSPCSNFCLDEPGLNVSDIQSSHTFSQDLTCLDSDYNGENSTAVGRKFRSCVSCEQTSTAVAPQVGNENDLYWFLFNLKSTIDWCVNGFFQAEQNPNVTLANSVCGPTCDPISKAIGDRLKQTNQTLQYNYCVSDNGGFMNGVDACKACLGGTDNLRVMANFLDALKSACLQQPSLGSTISLATNVFSTTVSSTSVFSTSMPTSVTAPMQTTKSSSGSAATSHKTGFPGAAIGGIIIGALVGLAVLAVGIFLVLRSRQKRKWKKPVELCGSQSFNGSDDSGSPNKNGFALFSPLEMSGDKPMAELEGGAGLSPRVREGSAQGVSIHACR